MMLSKRVLGLTSAIVVAGAGLAGYEYAIHREHKAVHVAECVANNPGLGLRFCTEFFEAVERDGNAICLSDRSIRYGLRALFSEYWARFSVLAGTVSAP